MAPATLPRVVLLTVVALTAATVTAHSASRREVPLDERVRGAERIIAGHVMMVKSEFTTNEFGDRLIVTRTRVVVSEVLKGRVTSSTMEVDLEGGTVGQLRLQVSDMPEVRPGDHVVLMLRESPMGRQVPSMRGQGVFKFNRQGRDDEQGITLEDIRAAAKGGRGPVQR